jgi:hypothetical protein
MVNAPGADALDRYGVRAAGAADQRRTRGHNLRNAETQDRSYVRDPRPEWTDTGDRVREASRCQLGMTWRASRFFESEERSHCGRVGGGGEFFTAQRTPVEQRAPLRGVRNADDISADCPALAAIRPAGSA